MIDWIKHIAFRWQDLVDIVLNSYILFRLYILFRGATTLLVLIGIGALWFFYLLAVYLGLVLTSWAIQGITAAAALIIIVVFRNEIRNVFQVNTLRAILWGFPRREIRPPVEIVAGTVFELAGRRIGALLVFPGRDALSDILQSGIAWKGLVSREMLLSIFWRDNPVHDGAAIIEGNIVSRVGTLLPLSNRQDAPSCFGTRHRAALGLVESTDAVVVVVSEERGVVTVFHNGTHRPAADADHLVRILNDLPGLVSRPASLLRRDGFRTAVAALISFLVVTTIWFSVTRGRDTLITLERPIEFLNRGPGMEIVETSERTVQLHLSGSSALIKSVRPDQVRVHLDLERAVVGTNTFTIQPDNVGLPPGISLSSVTPPGVDVILDVNAVKELPVQADWTGKLSDHWMITSVRLQPERIMVTGKSLGLRDIHTIYTEKIMVDHIDKSGRIVTRPNLAGLPVKINARAAPKIVVDFETSQRTSPLSP